MSKCIGLISHQSDNGVLCVFVPGKHPDLIIDQKTLNDEKCFHIGDFISFIDINGSITSPKRIKKLFETRLLNNRLQVKVPVAFPPEEFFERNTFTDFSYATLAWSPDFAFLGCASDVAKKYCRNQIYTAWIERVPRLTQNIAGVLVSWKIVNDVFDSCDENSKQLISKAPWNKKKISQYFRSNPCYLRRVQQKPLYDRRAFVKSLKKYIDNYEGIVTAVYDSSAKVWSLAIPDTEVVFLFGAREGMKVGDWVQFNCAPSLHPYLNCYLHGKKFIIIEPVLPAKPFNNTVQVEITMTITVNKLKYYPTGEVTVETEILGPVEFGSGNFRQKYCNKCLSLITCKSMPSRRTGAIWQVFCVVDEGCVEFMQHSSSTIPNTDDSPSAKVSTKKDEFNTEVEVDDYYFDESKLQEDFPSDSPGPAQKEIDDNVYSDISCNDNAFGNSDVENMKAEEEYDPLKELAFGAVEPQVLKINSSLYDSGTDKFETDNPSSYLNEEFSEDEQEELDNRATEYWIQVWQIPEVRRQIAKADKRLYTNVMQLMTDLNARTDGDTLEEAFKSLLNEKQCL
ncbi:Catalase-peroxidase [Dirofilaria immitis]